MAWDWYTKEEFYARRRFFSSGVSMRLSLLYFVVDLRFGYLISLCCCFLGLSKESVVEIPRCGCGYGMLIRDKGTGDDIPACMAMKERLAAVVCTGRRQWRMITR